MPRTCLCFVKTIRDLGCSFVQVLELSDNPLMGAAGVVALAGCLRAGLLPMLTALSLSMCKIADAGMAALCDAFVAAPRECLQYLYVHSNEITDDGAESLAAALHATPSLTALCLKKNLVGMRGQMALCCALERSAPALGTTSHGTLDLDNNAALDKPNRRELQQKLHALGFRPQLVGGMVDSICGTVWRRASSTTVAPLTKTLNSAMHLVGIETALRKQALTANAIGTAVSLGGSSIKEEEGGTSRGQQTL